MGDDEAARLISKRELLARSLCTLPVATIRWRGWIVLAYHRIGSADDTPTDPGLFSATAEEFAWQVQFVARNFPPTAPGDLLDPAADARQRVLFTFDDGYRDNASIAGPILHEHGMAGVFFLATDFLDHPRLPWWDRLAMLLRQAPSTVVDLKPWGDGVACADHDGFDVAHRKLLAIYKRLPGSAYTPFLDAMDEQLQPIPNDVERRITRDMWMTWDMVRSLRAMGHTIGGHTTTHPILANLAPSAQRDEIGGCLDRIAQETGERPSLFAYPVGGLKAFTAETEHIAAQCGVRMAFSYHGGWNLPALTARYAVKRQAVEITDGRQVFAARLTFPRLMIGRPG